LVYSLNAEIANSSSLIQFYYYFATGNEGTQMEKWHSGAAIIFWSESKGFGGIQNYWGHPRPQESYIILAEVQKSLIHSSFRILLCFQTTAFSY